MSLTRKSKENTLTKKGELQFDRDHIPASSYMIAKAKDDIKNGEHPSVTGFNPCMKKAIVCNAAVILAPQPIHTLGWTYGVDSMRMENNGDLSKTPNQIAQRDITTYRNMLLPKKPFNKKGETLPKKDRKKRAVANKKCKDNIIAGLDTLEKYHNFDKFLEKQILKNQDCDIVSWNGNC